MTLTIHEAAAEEVRDAALHYDVARMGLGDEFLAAVSRTFDRIQQRPRANAYEPRARPCRRRRVPRFPYRVVFLERTADIVVVAVPHDRRRPGYWRSRLK